MKFGIHMLATDEGIDVRTLGQAVEQREFESLFLAEHTHVPTDGHAFSARAAELPREFFRSLDPLVALGSVAAVTSQLKIGTAVCLIAERDPILLAKEVSTLDQLSGGRFLFGVGAGWNLTELRNHGTDPSQRWKVMRERVLAMRRIWTEDEASFHGEFVQFDPIWQWPKPVQRPHPPVLIGGEGPRVLQRVVEYGDEWFPNANGIADNHALLARIAELHELAAFHGRERIPVTLFGVAPEPAALEQCRIAGVSRCVFALRPKPVEDVLPELDRLAALVADFA